MALLPPLSLLLLILLLQRHRGSVLEACAWWGAAVAVATELLSLAHLIAPLPILTLWLAPIGIMAYLLWPLAAARGPQSIRWRFTLNVVPVALVLAAVFYWLAGAVDLLRHQVSFAFGSLLLVAVASGLPAVRRWKDAGSWSDRTLRSLLAILLLLIGVSAVLAPPNTWDALAYHMPRLIYWQQHRSVGLFPANYYNQLTQPPWTEFLFLHLQLLSHSDQYVNLVQWVAWLGCVCGVGVVARQLGANRRGVLLAMMLAATIPQAVLEASGPKNDCAEAFWLVCLVSLLLRFGSQPALRLAAAIGLATGLALLTKGTAYVYLPPLLLGLFSVWPRPAQVRLLRYAPLLAGLVLLLNGPQWARNWQVAGSLSGLPVDPAAAKEAGQVVNLHFGIGPTYSNLLRNLSIHFAASSTTAHRRVEAWVRLAHAVVGLNPDDPDLTWRGVPYALPAGNNHEALVGNAEHLLLYIVAGGWLVASAWRRREWERVGLLAGIGGAFLLFCALLQWQEWHARLHLPLFVLAAACYAPSLSRRLGAGPAGILALSLFMIAIPVSLTNTLRPLLGMPNLFQESRAVALLNDASYLTTDAQQAASLAVTGGCLQIGLDTRRQQYQYALMSYARALRPGAYFVASAPFRETQNFTNTADRQPACAVICTACNTDPAHIADHYTRYGSVRRFGTVFVFQPQTVRRTDTCSFQFTAGWYEPEQARHGTLRWAADAASVVIRAAQSREVRVHGEVALPSTSRSKVQLFVNGALQGTFTGTHFLDQTISLVAGDNLLELKGALPGERIGNDPRRLGFTLTGLTVRSTDDQVACTEAPK